MPRSPSHPPSRWLRALAGGGVVGAAVASAWVGLVHCDTSTTTTTYTPITGVEIASASLAAGHGCSDDPNMPNAIYRYAAVLSYVYEGGVQPGLPDSHYAAVFDCFADGYFENLPVADGGNQSFALQIAVWNAAGFPQQLAPCIAEPTGPNATTDVCPAEMVSEVLSSFDGGVAGVDGAAAPPQWTTTCTAYLQPFVPSIAACGPLQPYVASPTLPNDGSANDGSATETDGSANDGSATETDGSANDGSATDGSAEGSATDGSANDASTGLDAADGAPAGDAESAGG